MRTTESKIEERCRTQYQPSHLGSVRMSLVPVVIGRSLFLDIQAIIVSLFLAERSYHIQIVPGYHCYWHWYRKLIVPVHNIFSHHDFNHQHCHHDHHHQYDHNCDDHPDMIFVKTFTRPYFLGPKFYIVANSRQNSVNSHSMCKSLHRLCKVYTSLCKRFAVKKYSCT